MKKGDHMVFKDNKNSLWEFNLTEDNSLVYSTVAEDEKSKEEGRIDSDVVEFAVDIDDKGVVHFVYITKDSLKYCTLDEGQWSSKTIHRFEGNNFTVRELGLYLIGKDANIFYIFQKDLNVNIGTICHCLWDGEKASINIISDINMLPTGRVNYQAEVLQNGDIWLLFISNDGRDVLFKSCVYSNRVFSSIGLLYALKGNSMDFHMVNYGNEYHILNLSYDNQNYMLEDICIESPGKIKSITKLYQDNRPISDSLLLVYENILWAFWKVENKVFYSSLTGRLSRAQELSINPDVKVNMYYYLDQVRDGKYKKKRMFGTASPNINLIFPDKLPINEDADTFSSNDSKMTGVETSVPSDSACSSQYQFSSQSSLKEIMESSRREWRQALGKIKCNTSGKSIDKSPPAASSSCAQSYKGWSSEMRQNLVVLARQKLELEKKYNKLNEEKLSLEEETDKLKKLLDEERSQKDALQEKIKQLEITLKELEEENQKLKNDLEVEMNRGILDIICRRIKGKTQS